MIELKPIWGKYFNGSRSEVEGRWQLRINVWEVEKKADGEKFIATKNDFFKFFLKKCWTKYIIDAQIYQGVITAPKK